MSTQTLEQALSQTYIPTTHSPGTFIPETGMNEMKLPGTSFPKRYFLPQMHDSIDLHLGATALYSGPVDFSGSLGQSMGSANYIKMFPNGDKLSVHAPKGIVTGAKLNNQPISNYEAAMHDLRSGTIKTNTGGQW
ncbi:MAG: hypothetical protein KC535_02695 [Nanoarchaeota archaeon]|nr:hypothetical protein [Nanoarchaeota archaeon]